MYHYFSIFGKEIVPDEGVLIIQTKWRKFNNLKQQMRKNPFITIILLIFIEILLYNYIDYTNLVVPSSKYADLMVVLFVFSIPVIAILISSFLQDISYKKEFKYFSRFLIIASFFVFAAILYLGALAKAYQH